MVLEALSIEFRTGFPWELLYADDLVLIAETMEELVGKFEKGKTGLEDKGLRVNAAKTKVMISSSEARSGFEYFSTGVSLRFVRSKKKISIPLSSPYMYMYVCMPFYVIHYHNNLMKAHHYYKSHQISSASLEKMNIIILVFK